ncbi:MAG: ATP synthase F1 subunit epsilon [Proteobacteria bacterium]|nr:ATP synthase F1 subunit epsilon [Pseudomonadota bacterium]
METEAEYVTIPGEMGELGILPSHIPLLTNLQSGVLSYKNSGVEKKIAVHFGYAEVCQDKITILANQAELAENIDLEGAKSDQEKAEAELAEVLKDSDKIDLANDLQQQIKIAVSRQNAAS